MDFWEVIEFLASNIVILEVLTDITGVIIGAGLCFGALKWRRGTLTTTAIGWGFFIGVFIVALMSDSIEEEGILFWLLVPTLLLPVLTYTVPGVNRFVLGYIVGFKLCFMLTTLLAKEGDIDVLQAIAIPVGFGTLLGLGLMAWTRVRVSAFILACSFLGASEIAPVIAKWINRLLFMATGSIEYIFDPIDMFFALFKVELTDGWTFLILLVLMAFGAYRQFRALKEKGVPLDTPIIGFETPDKRDNGKIYTDDGVIDTLSNDKNEDSTEETKNTTWDSNDSND